MALNTLVALFLTVVLSSDRCPLSGFLSFANSQKSQGAMSYSETAAQDSINALERYRGDS